MEFDKQLPEESCEVYFQKMFKNIWMQDVLELILFEAGFKNSNAYDDVLKQNNKLAELGKQATELEFLADYFGCSLWEAFSNNNTVFSINNYAEFSIGSWRGSGRFIASFIERKNKDLQFNYVAFYMGHLENKPEAKKSFEFIFNQLKNNGFDWQYEYPQLGIADLSSTKQEVFSSYHPNEAIEKENSKKNLLQLIEEINTDRKKDSQASATPAIIIAYANIFGKYPLNWEN